MLIVAFSAVSQVKGGIYAQVNAVQFAHSRTRATDWRIFLAAGNRAYCYDLRKDGCAHKALLKEEDLLCSFP